MSNSVALNAKDHFINVAAGDIPAAVDELMHAAARGMKLENDRDYGTLSAVTAKYLGRDTDMERVNEEWEAIRPDEQTGIDSATNDVGRISFFNSMAQIQAPLALLIAAKLLLKEEDIGYYQAQKLRDPEMVKSITTRFPIIRAADITEALELA